MYTYLKTTVTNKNFIQEEIKGQIKTYPEFWPPDSFKKYKDLKLNFICCLLWV
jgi:hypothetical protein